MRRLGCIAAICAFFAITMGAGQNQPGRPSLELRLVDRDGRQTRVGMVPASTFAPRVSPDGHEVLFDTNEDGAIWIAKLSDISARRRLTAEGRNRGPLWSGDGKRVFYVTDHEGAETLFSRMADGSGSAELVTKPARAPESWSSTANALSFITFKDGGDYDVWTYSLTTKRASPLVVTPTSAQHSSQFSPDGRWLAYVSAESGRLEVYVRPVVTPGPAVQITQGGGGHPQWSPDQKELFFDNAGRMYVVRVTASDAGFTAEKSVPLPIEGFVQGPLRRQYDLMPDGKQFLMLFRTT